MTHDPATLAAGAAMSRPTCATCDHYKTLGKVTGECWFPLRDDEPPRPRPLRKIATDWCSEHPDMPAWIAAKKEPTDG